jgi:hypothetical protein
MSFRLRESFQSWSRSDFLQRRRRAPQELNKVVDIGTGVPEAKDSELRRGKGPQNIFVAVRAEIEVPNMWKDYWLGFDIIVLREDTIEGAFDKIGTDTQHVQNRPEASMVLLLPWAVKQANDRQVSEDWEWPRGCHMGKVFIAMDHLQVLQLTRMMRKDRRKGIGKVGRQGDGQSDATCPF